MPDIFAEVQRDHANPSQQPRPEAPMSAIRQLHDIATQLSANPLIAAITAHPGMGQNLNSADVDTIMRVVASIEAARIEVPQRYQHDTGDGRAVYGGTDHETIA